MNITEAEASVNEAARTATEWVSNIAAIRSKIADAKQRVVDMEGTRREHALSAALDKSQATKALTAAHKDQAAAEKLADDLAYALEQANVRLAEAEIIHGGAVLALSRAQAQQVIERRVLAAEEIDKAFSQLEVAIRNYDATWRELAGINFGDDGFNMSLIESRRGDNRLPAAIPPALRKLLNLAGHSASLAASERLVWRALA